MDVTGCPPGLATDRAFLQNPRGLCNVKLTEFYCASLTICFIRLIAFLAKIAKYFSSVGCTFRSRRIISVTVSFVSTVNYFLFAILTGLNVINVDNGWAFTVFSMAYLCFMIDFSMMLFKIVRLGRGVIAIPREQEVGETEYLRRFTRFGKIMVVFQFFAALGSCVALLILSPIFPEHDVALGTAGFATKGVFQALCSAGIVLQFERCVRALDKFLLDRGAIASTFSSPPASSDIPDTVRRVIIARNILRHRQIFVFAFGGGVALILLLLAICIPWTWAFVLLLTGGPEATGHLVAELVLNRRRKPSAKSTSYPVPHGQVVNSNNDRSMSSKFEGGSEVVSQENGVVNPSPVDGSVSRVKVNRVKKPRRKPRKQWRLDLSRIAEESSKAAQDTQVSTFTSLPLS